MVAFSILPILIPAADGYLLYKFSQPTIRHWLWTYFSLSRSLILVIIVYAFNGYFLYDSASSGDNSVVMQNFALVAAALMVSLTGVFIYREIKGKWQLTILITTAVSTLLAIVFLIS